MYCEMRNNLFFPPGNRQQIQAVIDANLFPVLIEILQKSEFKTRKEAAWAITNATSGGTPDQIRYLVEQGCIPPLCELLTVMDAKIVLVNGERVAVGVLMLLLFLWLLLLHFPPSANYSLS